MHGYRSIAHRLDLNRKTKYNASTRKGWQVRKRSCQSGGSDTGGCPDWPFRDAGPAGKAAVHSSERNGLICTFLTSLRLIMKYEDLYREYCVHSRTAMFLIAIMASYNIQCEP